jgi:putative GTP pyrophosphokinase
MSDLATVYERRFETVLQPLAKAIESQLQEYLADTPRIDRVVARAKSVDRFITKAQSLKDEKPRYSEPLNQIQDQIGARIITFYLSDVESVSAVIERYYRPIEAKLVVPDSQWEFGYFGQHYILLVPSDVVDERADKDDVPQFFELQIKTLFQHAWSEAEHDLGYKPQLGSLDPMDTRRLAFSSAQAWGADQVFDQLFRDRTLPRRPF